MDKQKIIDAANNIKNEPIADLKKNLVENSSGTNYKGLMQYNAMLDNITIGAHTTTAIEFAGIEWRLRLLTADELVNIKKEVNKIAKDEDWWDEVNLHYNTMVKVLAKALSPSPFKTEGNAVLSEADLKLINYDVLENIYRQYIHFNDIATQKPTEMSPEEIEDTFEIVKKKPIQLKDLDWKRLLIMASYGMTCLRNQEKMRKDDSNS